MTRYVALLHAVNVGGTGKLAMSALKTMCIEAGFADVATYIASGNVVFDSAVSETKVQAELTARLASFAGKPVGVAVRSGAEMQAVLDGNPYADLPAKASVAIFLDLPPPADAIARASGLQDERIALGKREIYVHFGAGMARSKLRWPAPFRGTARNMNTVAALARMAAQR